MEDPLKNSVSFSSPKKTKNLKSKLIFWGIFLVLFIIVFLSVFLLYFWNKNKQDDIIKFVPLDSVLYATARNSIFGKSKIIDLPFSNFVNDFSKADFLNGNDLSLILNNSKRFSIALFSVEGNELAYAYIFEFANKDAFKPLNGFEISKNIFVFSENKKVFEKMKEVTANNIFSLASQVDLKFIESNLFSFYFNPFNLKFYLSEKNIILDNIFLKMIDENMYFGLNKKSDHYDFRLKTSSGNYEISKTKAITAISFLPENFRVYIGGLNFYYLFDQLKKIEPNISESFGQTKNDLGLIYKNDLSSWVLDFFRHDFDLLIFEPTNNSVFGFEYVLASGDFNQIDEENLKSLIKIFLAQKYPKESEYTLPDGTKVTEFLVDVDKWQWQIDKLENNLEISYLLVPELDSEVAYAIKDDVLFLASSVKLLNNYFNVAKVEVSEIFSSCGQGKFYGRGIIINPFGSFFVPEEYALDGLVVGESKGNSFSGCILEK